MLPDQWYLLANAKGPIRSVKDLDGKKIGVSSKNSTTDFYALWSGKHAGIKIQTVPLGGSTWPALKSDQVSAIVASGQLSLHLLLAKEARPLLHFREAMEPNIPECWVATSKIIRERPKVIRGFVDAVERATEKMQKDQAFGMAFLKKYLDEKNDAYVKLAYDKVIKTLTTDGRVDLKALGNSLELAKLAGITNLPEPKSLVPDFAVAPASK
jgi:ABC-type nitrate/sulfonate/bicarbonate transport system substrate-binding protein